MVIEAVVDQFVNFSLELKQLLSEQMRVLDIVLLHNDLLAALKDVWVHLLDDQAEGVLVTLKGVVQQFKLIQVLLLEHVDAAGVFRADCFGHLCNQLILHDFQHLRFRLWLQPVLCVGFFILQHLFHFTEVLGTVPI